MYAPGETLNPACGPTDPTCTVSAPLYSTASLDIGSSPQAGYYTATTTTATSTFAGGLSVAGSSGLTVLQNGRVGFGTQSPAGNFDLRFTSSRYFVALQGNSPYLFRYDDNATPDFTLENRDITATTDHGFDLMFKLANNSVTTALDAARIRVAKEQQWTTDTATQDSYMSFFTTTNGTSGLQEKMRLSSAGNLGIGSTSPSARLTVTTAGISTGKSFVFENSLGNTTLSLFDNGYLNLKGSNLNVGRNIVFFGDSITAGIGNDKWNNLISLEKDLTQTNLAVSGYILNQMIPNIFSQTVSTSSQYATLCCVNDMKTADTAAEQNTFNDEIKSSIAWLSIPDYKKITGRSASVSYTGSWSNSTNIAYGKGKVTTELGATASFDVFGSSVYIGSIRTDDVSGGEFILSIDGINMGTYLNYGARILASGAGEAQGTTTPFLIRISNLENKKHTVLITTTAVSGDGVYFEWGAGSAGAGSFSGPKFYVGNTLRFSATGYATYGGSDTIVSQLNEIIRNNVRDFASDGLNAILVDASGYYFPELGDISDDNAHPSNQGHRKIADAFLESMNGVIYPSDRQGASFMSGRVPSISLGTLPAISGNVRLPFDGIIAWRSTTTPSINASMLVQNSSDSLYASTTNFGIGTTSPQRKLHIANTGANSQLLLEDTLASANQHYSSIGFSRGIFNINTLDDNFVSSTKLTILSNGNVGIGTTSPEATFVVNNTGTTDTAKFRRSSAASSLTLDFNAVLGGDSADTVFTSLPDSISGSNTGFSFRNYTSGVLASPIFAITGSGRVGISTSSPSAKFAIAAYDNDAATTFPIMMIDENDNVDYWIKTSGNGVASSLVQYFRGSLGIGTTSPAAKLAVVGSSYFAGSVITTSTVQFSGLATNAAANALCIDATGNITTAAVAACSGVSSQRYKHDITDLDLGLSSILAMRPVSFRFNNGYGDSGLSPQFGLIAEEVNTVDSRLTTLDKDGQPNAVRYDFLAPILIKAIQEQQLQIDSLMGSTTSSVSLSSGFMRNIFNGFLDFLQSAVAKVKSLFVGELQVDDRLKVGGEVCVDNICVTKDQFKQMLLNAGGSVENTDQVIQTSSNSDNSTTTPDSTATTTPVDSDTTATSTEPVKIDTATTSPETISTPTPETVPQAENPTTPKETNPAVTPQTQSEQTSVPTETILPEPTTENEPPLSVEPNE